jgi:thymidylate kinase
MQFEAQNRFLAEYGKALEAFFASNVYSNMALEDRKLVIGSFLKMGSLWNCIKGSLPDETVVFFEEGFVQKSFLFVDQSNGSLIEKEKLCSYLENIPLPDVIIYITANIETCQRRMIDRADGLTERLKSADRNEVSNFLSTAENHLKYVAEWLNDNCSGVIVEVNSEKELNAISQVVINKLQRLMK